MTEHPEEVANFLDKSMEEMHDEHPDCDLSSSGSDDENLDKSSLFIRRKCADVLLWKNKKTSAGVLVGATLIYLLFEWFGCHLLTLICHVLMLSITIMFLWSNVLAFITKFFLTPLEIMFGWSKASNFIKQSTHIPKISLSEELFQNMALALRFEINEFFSVLYNVASRKDLKKSLMVIVNIFVLSKVGRLASFMTLFYAVFVIAHTVPVLYMKYEDQVTSFAEMVKDEVKKHYRTFDAILRRKIPLLH